MHSGLGGTSSLRAGELLTISAGVISQPGPNWTLEATLGWKYTGRQGSNGDISFTRFPLDVVASFARGNHRVGLGPSLHLGPSLDCSGTVCGIGRSISMPTAVGLVAQWAYRYRYRGAGGEAGFRYTRIHYAVEGYEPIDGSSVGFFLGVWR